MIVGGSSFIAWGEVFDLFAPARSQVAASQSHASSDSREEESLCHQSEVLKTLKCSMSTLSFFFSPPKFDTVDCRADRPAGWSPDLSCLQ